MPGLRRGRCRRLTLQNAAHVLELSDRGHVLELGRNRFEGPGSEWLADPRVRHLYLGAEPPPEV